MTAAAPVTDDWRSQEAIEQARRRHTNESIEASMHMTGRCPAHMFFCECGDLHCARTVTVTIQEYESIREWPTHFMVAANHENPEVECLVSEMDRFTVIETLTGEASKVALRTDPRSLYAPDRK